MRRAKRRAKQYPAQIEQMRKEQVQWDKARQEAERGSALRAMSLLNEEEAASGAN